VACADEALYRYEGDILPYDVPGTWTVYDPCEEPCSESLGDGDFVLTWPHAGNFANYSYRIAEPPESPPPSLWVEWRFRSNHPFGHVFWGCDGRFSVKYGGMFEVVYMYGDAAISISGDDAVTGLDINEFHTYRFESLDGVNYWISVDGLVFIVDADDVPNGYHTLQFGGRGGCASDQIPDMVNEWDFIRFGTISYGEQIVAHDPPERVLDAREHAELDRFTVTFDSPNYVYIDEIMVYVTGGVPPEVIQTRRRENDEPDTVEIVLDGPLPMGETTYFVFDDGVGANVVAYTFAPGDTDGDGLATLADVAALQNCFGQTDLTGVCRAVDLIEDDIIDLSDFAALTDLLTPPNGDWRDRYKHLADPMSIPE
jgi:hypothetical protein